MGGGKGEQVCASLVTSKVPVEETESHAGIIDQRCNFVPDFEADRQRNVDLQIGHTYIGTCGQAWICAHIHLIDQEACDETLEFGRIFVRIAHNEEDEQDKDYTL